MWLLVNQRPILGYVSWSPHGNCALTELKKPWPIIQSINYATGLYGTVLKVALVALVAEYHGGQIMVLPPPYIWPVIQWQRGASRKASFLPAKNLPQTKGTC